MTISFSDVEAEFPYRNIWFQQDGASPHFYKTCSWVSYRYHISWQMNWQKCLSGNPGLLTSLLQNTFHVSRNQNIEELEARMKEKCPKLSWNMECFIWIRNLTVNSGVECGWKLKIIWLKMTENPSWQYSKLLFRLFFHIPLMG